MDLFQEHHAHDSTDVYVVQISMELALQNPLAFVNHGHSQSAVVQGIAVLTGVDVTAVNATLSVARRLNVHFRNLQTTANVYAEVVVTDSAEAVSLASEVSAMSPQSITATLNGVLESADVPVLEVLSVEAMVAPTVEATVAPTETSFSQEPTPTSDPLTQDSNTEFTDETSSSSVSGASAMFLVGMILSMRSIFVAEV